MNKKNIVKFSLDAVMVVILALLYNKSSVKAIHYLCSAASLIFIGIHLGLHTQFLFTILQFTL